MLLNVPLLGIILFLSATAEAMQNITVNWDEISFEEMTVAELVDTNFKSLRDITSKLRDSEALQEFEKNAEVLFHKANSKEWIRALDAPDQTFPYIVCRGTEKSTSGYEAAQELIELLKKNGGTDDMIAIEPILNTDDSYCAILHTLGQVALRAASEDRSISFQPYLNSFKLLKKTWDTLSTAHDTDIPRSVDFDLCPSAVRGLNDTTTTTINDEALVILNNVTLLKEYIVFWDDDDIDVPNRRFWDRIFSVLEEDVCTTVIAERLEWEYSNGVLSLTVNGNTFTDSLCTVAITAAVMVLPEVCSIAARPALRTRNKRAQWLVQSGLEEERPMHDFGIMGDGQIVAVSDTGLDTQNCYFRDPEVSVSFDQNNYKHRKVLEYQTFPGDNRDYEYGHGTHVVGSILGSQGNPNDPNQGMVPGMAPKAKVAFMDMGRGEQLYGAASSQFTGMGRPEAKLHSASWGDFPYNTGYTFQSKDFDKYMYQNDDFLMILAAGNDGYGDGQGTVGSPSTSKNCLSVGASHSYGNDLDSGFLGLFGFQKGPNHLADFSSRGPTSDGRNKPDLVAPGKYILSAGAQPAAPGSCDPGSEPSVGKGKAGVKSMAGTSMATPVTAGHAALVREYFEKGLYEQYFPEDYTMPELTNTNISGALVKAILMNGAQYLSYVDGGGGPKELKPYDYNQNYGRVSMIDSVYLPGKSNRQIQVWDRQTINSKQKQTFDITINQSNGCASKVLSVTLAWMDKPGYTGCKTNCLLNNLDMTLQQKGTSKVHYPNGRSSPDTNNNVERIQIMDATGGQIFQITVEAANLDGRQQNYALVATGCFGGVAQTLDTSADVFANDNSNRKQTNIIIGFSVGGAFLLAAFFYGPKLLKKYRARRAAKQRDARLKEQGLLEQEKTGAFPVAVEGVPGEDLETQQQDQSLEPQHQDQSLESEFNLAEEINELPTANNASRTLDEQVAAILAESDDLANLDVSAVLSDPDHDAVFEDGDEESHVVQNEKHTVAVENPTAEKDSEQEEGDSSSPKNDKEEENDSGHDAVFEDGDEESHVVENEKHTTAVENPTAEKDSE